MLRWRLLLGAALIAALAGVMILDCRHSMPGTWLLVLAMAAGLGAAHEVVGLLRSGGYRPLPSVIYFGTLAVIASNALPLHWRPVGEDHALERLGWPLLTFAGTILVAFIGEMRRYQQPGGVIVNVALAVFGVAYAGLLLSFAVELRLLGGPQDGIVALAALVIVVKMGDTGAYTVGRLIGRHKMAPRISPGKTWEGAVGGLLFATLGAWLAFTYVPRLSGVTLSQAPWSWMLFGPVVGVAGILGDLAESLFKRDVGRKDSSEWMPGFGGVLDLLDSILFAAPVAYACWWLGMQ